MTDLVMRASGELFSTVVRVITGRLYTDEQIRAITSGAVGRYFAEFFPTPKDEFAARERADSARQHIEAASAIIRDMQEDLEAQDRELGKLLEEVEDKKQLADRYQALANTNREAFDAFRAEMEDALRKELRRQAENGKRLRQAVSAVLWLITLVLGAALGTYFKDIVAWVQA
ncbi:MAG: hypothetical protein AAF533_11265 [Acidobacteriota bacterium]